MGRTIAANGGRRLMIFHEDVSAVFGTPSSGKEVWDASFDKSQAMRERIQDILGMEDENASPTLAARKTLRSLAGKDITAADEKAFKTSFIVAVVGLLCDSKNPGDTESVNFWPAISDPDKISQFNWSSYVLDSVFSACASARMATRTNTPYSPPTGTAIFLQVCVAFLHSKSVCLAFHQPPLCFPGYPNGFLNVVHIFHAQIYFLDNMDYGDISLPKSPIPRMELYDARTLSKQLLTETQGLRGHTPCRVFGAGKVSPFLLAISLPPLSAK
jgi:hypothetical protein